jgi:hypothetical protein
MALRARQASAPNGVLGRSRAFLALAIFDFPYPFASFSVIFLSLFVNQA